MVCFRGCFQGLCGLPSCAAWFGIFKTIWARTRAPMRRRTSALAAAAALATASALAATSAVAAASALSAARALAAACAFAAASALAATSALAAAAALASPPQPSPSPPSPPQPSPSPPSPRGTPSVQFPLLEPRFSTLLMAVAWPRPAPPIKVWRSEEDGRKLLDAATTEWENSDTVNRPTRLDTQSSSATPANDGQTLSSTDAATATGRPALRAERECSRPT